MIPPISAVCLKTAVADSHMFASVIASCSVLPVKHLMILSTASLLECNQNITSLQHRASSFGVQMNC
jgi:hypothetical protein